jgi:transcriptional regulator with XRE-family HTH domain
MQTTEHFSKILIELMRGQGMTQTELAQKLETRQSTVSHWVQGVSLPRQKTVREIAKILRTTVAYLNGAKSDEQPAPPAPLTASQPATHTQTGRDARQRSIEELLAEHGSEHCALLMDGTLDSMKGNPLHVRLYLEYLGKLADYLISQDPALLAQAQWLAALDDKHLSSTPPESELPPSKT